MTKNTLMSIGKTLELLISVSLIILIVTGCVSQQEIRAKQSVDRASSAYVQAKANPKVEANAPTLLTEAGRLLQEAKDARSYREMERLGYLSEKKTQIAVTAAEGKEFEKAREALKKEEADLLNQKRLLGATVQAQSAQAEAEQARRAAAAEASTAEKAKKEAEASQARALSEAEKAERSKKEAEQARLQSREEAEKAEQARLQSREEAEKAEKARRETEQAKAEIDQFLKDLSDLQGKMTERGIVLTMGDVLFSSGKADLSAGAVRNLDKITGFLQKHPDRNLLIEGHTDSIGSDEFNQALSQKRADAVKEALVGKGVVPDRIVTKGYGKQFPMAGNDTESGRQMNRRVEVVILNEGVKPETVLR
jgi:outer membrane protein OmpA-like peptidoglycan-associated protein